MMYVIIGLTLLAYWGRSKYLEEIYFQMGRYSTADKIIILRDENGKVDGMRALMGPRYTEVTAGSAAKGMYKRMKGGYKLHEE